MQQKVLRDYARQQGLVIVGLTAEQGRGISHMRPGIVEVSLAVEQGLVDILLVVDITRLGRGVLETRRYIRWLNDHNLRLVCINWLDADCSVYLSMNTLAFQLLKTALYKAAHDAVYHIHPTKQDIKVLRISEAFSWHTNDNGLDSLTL